MKLVVVFVWKGIFVDSKYSMAADKVAQLVVEYEKIGLQVALADLHTEDEIIGTCADADVLICNGNPPITCRVLEALPKVKVVQRFGIGVDSIDLKAAVDHGVIILNQPGISLQELSVHTTGLILDLLRNISFYDRGIRQGQWRKGKGVPCPPMQDLTLGLFGFGGTSRLLYRIFHDGLRVGKIIACDPYLTKTDIPDFDVELVSFEELLKQSDILTIHVHLNEETYHKFDYEALKKMKPSALLINISRGPIVCEADLVRALQEGVIRGAGLDVFETEPMPADHPLAKMDNVVLTCHSAFLGVNARRVLAVNLIDQMNQIISENSISHVPVANRGVVPKIPGFKIL